MLDALFYRGLYFLVVVFGDEAVDSAFEEDPGDGGADDPGAAYNENSHCVAPWLEVMGHRMSAI